MDLPAETGNSDDQEPGVLVPGIGPPARYSRNYESIPQPGLNNRTSPVWSAAVVGGGTVINGMFFNRGSAGDYDAWEKLGNPRWAWNDLLPYFKKVSHLVVPSILMLTSGGWSSERDVHSSPRKVSCTIPHLK